MAHPLGDIFIADYGAFAAQQVARRSSSIRTWTYWSHSGMRKARWLERVRADVYAPSERAVAQRAVGAPPECGVVRPIEGHRRNRETPVPWVFSGTSDARCHRRRRRSWQRPARSSARGSTQARWSASADGANTRLPAPVTERWFDQPSEPKPKPLTNWSQGLGRGGTNLTRGG